MDSSFATGLTSFPLFIEIKNNVDGSVTFSTDNSLSQQLELILTEPVQEEESKVKIEEDDSSIDVKDFLKYSDAPDDDEDDDGKMDTQENKIFNCNECSENFDTKEIYDIHMSGHANNMKCAICNMVLKSLKNYEKHCLRCKPYECQICGRVVRFRPNFIKHMRVHTGQQSERHKYKCEVCQKEFMSFEYFKVHKKIHNKNVNLTCDVCGKVFSALASLRGHSKLHTGIKLHKCEVCGKGFGQRYNLKIHSRVHTGEIPYECGICKRKMHTQSSYQNHMQTHQKDQGSQTVAESTINNQESTKTTKKIESKKDKKKQGAEKETQTVVQNIQKIRNNKSFVIPTVSDALPQEIYDSKRNESPNEGPAIHNFKNETDLFKLNSVNTQINKTIKKEINNDMDDDDDDDDDDDGILIRSTKNSTGDYKFQTDFENDFVDSNDLANSLPYSNIFESNAISNSISDGIYMDDDHDSFHFDQNPLLNLQSTTDGNFIRREWVYSNNYSSGSKFDDDEFSEAASFIYD